VLATLGAALPLDRLVATASRKAQSHALQESQLFGVGLILSTSVRVGRATRSGLVRQFNDFSIFGRCFKDVARL